MEYAKAFYVQLVVSKMTEMSQVESTSQLRRNLSYFDLMNIVIGAIVGSDIYIVPGLTARLVGPFAIVVWILSGAVSMVLVMVFAYCSYYVPNVGGSYAYATAAFSNFYGFIAGWSMCIAEIVALPVFAIVFTNYLQVLSHLTLRRRC